MEDCRTTILLYWLALGTIRRIALQVHVFILHFASLRRINVFLLHPYGTVWSLLGGHWLLNFGCAGAVQYN